MSRRFDIFPNPSKARPQAPYIVLLQSHLLPDFPTVVVAPLRRRSASEGIMGLQVQVDFADEPLAVMLSELTHIPRRLLQRRLGDISAYEDDLLLALSRLFNGF